MIVVQIVLFTITGIATLFVFILIGFHCFLMSRNLTTHEHLKKMYSRLGTPYHKGSIITNIWASVCYSKPPSLFKFMIYDNNETWSPPSKLSVKKVFPVDPQQFEV